MLVELRGQVGDASVLDFAGLGEVALALGGFELVAKILDLPCQFARLLDLLFLVLPLGLELGALLLEVGEFLLQLGETLLAGGVLLLLERRALHLGLHDLAFGRSSSVGIESSSIFSRDAASSMRSTALSGRSGR